MQVGETQLPLEIAILFIVLLLSLIFNIFLYTRGHQSYSIKYEIMLNDRNFRVHQWLTSIVEFIYKSFFVLPFLLLVAIAVLRALSGPIDLPIILVNGLIVLLITYPFKTSFYYIKEVVLWALAIASQFISLFLQGQSGINDYYTLLCVIFYPINCILFCLALLSREDKYWEIENALKFPAVEERLKQICSAFTEKEDTEVLVEERQKEQDYFEQTTTKKTTITKFVNIPEIFNGGIFGTLCRERLKKKFTVLYFLSLCILAINAVVIWKTSGSSLGVIGLITNFIYDLFIFSFNVLATPERSIRNVFILVFAGRFLSFVFGEELWIFGYCVLYFFVGIFIGKILINSRLPLRNLRKQRNKKMQTNAFQTPEFVLFILTVEIFLLVLASSLGVGSSRPNVSYSETVSISLWQFAILVVIATWVVILYMASVRMYKRNINNIKEEVEYYFGSKALREHHVYVLVTYLLVIGLGLYCNYFLGNSTALYASIFLPLILLAVNKLLTEWVNNEYQMLADIPEYNRRIEKMNHVIEKKEKAITKQKEKGRGRRMEEASPETNKVLISSLDGKPEQSKEELIIRRDMDNEILSNSEASEQMNKLESQKRTLNSLEDWRELEASLNLQQFWECLTPSDKWIIIMVITITLYFVGFILCSYLLSNSLFGIFIVICLVSFLSLMPFYRYACTFKDFILLEYVWFEFGFVLGVVYWSAYHEEVTYAMVWGGLNILGLGAMLAYGITKKIEETLIYWLIANLGLTILFICIFLGFTVPPLAAIVVSVVLFLACIGAVPVAFVYIKGHLPTPVKALCGIFIIGGIVGLSIAGFVLGFASNFAVFTFIMACIYIILMLIGGVIFLQKQSDKYENPHVYSAFGEPIYRFDSASEQLKSSKNHKVLFDIASAVLVVYAAVVSLMFTEKEWSIYVLGFYCCETFFQNILFALKTYEELAANSAELNEELMLKTLDELEGKYMCDFKENKYSQDLEKTKERMKQEAEKAVDARQLDQKWLEIAQFNTLCIKNREEEDKFLYFWIVLIEFHIFTKSKAKMVTFINHVKEIEEELINLGIFLQSLSYALDFSTKYELLSQEIESLGPFDYLNFDEVLRRHQEESKNQKKFQQKKGKEIDELQQQKEQNMYQNLKKELSKTKNEKIEEFNSIIQGLGKSLYTDKSFPPLTDGLEMKAPKWRRPTPKEELIKGTISAYDVRQGDIGDCYLISSLGVLGAKWILPALGIIEGGKTRWTNKRGAYMVRFFKFSKEVFVIIDDLLPVDENDEYVFARSEEENEIWPCILEKAYAKLYDGYENIVEGQAHRVFAELSGGVPFEIQTSSYTSNPNGLWQKIINATVNSYLMGAASNSHDEGDRAHSKRNIVYGHAYSILDAKEVEGYKLLKLKNPHGSQGKEWNGDFSDGSSYMNDRMMQLLGHEKKDDGIFWIKLDDFMHEFRSLYICAIFDPQHFLSLGAEGEFTKQNSFGTPSKSSKTFRNPQYGLTVHNKCTVFANLTQLDTIGTYKGKNYIYMRIQRVNGSRISNLNKNDGVCGLTQSPKNTISVTSEVVLEADSYPCTFTIYLSCEKEGDTGGYKLDIYCTDMKAEFIPDQEFDRSQF